MRGVCPTRTIEQQKKGFRVLLGGKLGRHPRLAMELPDVYTEKEVLEIIQYCISLYKRNSRHGQRFAHIFKDSDFELLAKKLRRFRYNIIRRISHGENNLYHTEYILWTPCDEH